MVHQTQKQYDLVWDKKKHIRHFKSTIPPAIEQALREHHPHSILDLGCGEGTNLIALAHQGYLCSGIDISNVGVQKTKEKASKLGVSVDVRVGDIYKPLPYRDHLFDAVITLQAINHNTLPHIMKTMHEIRRVLRPGGLFCIKTASRSSFHLKLIKEDVYRDSDWDVHFQKIDDQTFKPLEGDERGIIHYAFRPRQLRELLEGLDFKRQYVGNTKYHTIGIFQLNN
jgi:SAM-dependent methyltransferase